MKNVTTSESTINISGLNKLFNHRTRMGIMALLMVSEWVEFVSLRKTLKLTDGSLASHLKALVKEDQIAVEKKFINDKPRTSYRATAAGRKAFEAHLTELEAFIRQIDN
ncbi:winged helix-turn-helix domain-containing protein [Neolewinella antarctica]|uniref:DNA-binding MarR family transcriptional regulator n=1 Tax=Neolewinella antarctica TaxID=442734 RepID=A0ABX0XA15_9BACT|nr:transcriptional regulator [Neolewinella antarctica]NJC26094.1 DNA-binding MarR family transcriptional regulator [Neolewinella antarctica]